MPAGIDHLIVACPDPDAAAAELEARVGLTCDGGGRHPGAGTRNRLAFLADGSYIELIGIEDRSLAAGSPVGAAALDVLDVQGGGFAGYALRDDELERRVALLVASGSGIGPAARGSRVRDDGEEVEWWTAFPAETGSHGLPFLIRHARHGAEWGPEALSRRASFVHPLGSPVVLARLDLAVDDPPAAASEYHRQLGIEFWAVADLAVASVGSHTIRLVPRREMPVAAVVTLGAEVDQPRSVEALGLRFDVERVALPLPAPNRA